MWTIRQEQTEAFRLYHLQKFEDEMVEHLKNFSPQYSKVAGEPAVRQVIRIGVESAKKYGFTNRGPVRFYIELMFMFGSYFDTDPQCFWGAAVLNSTVLLDEAGRADRLYYRLKDYMAEVSGPNQQDAIAALRRASEIELKSFTSSRGNLEDSVVLGLRSIYPKKFEYIGLPAISRLVNQSFEVANHCLFSTREGRALIALLAFMLGHRSIEDPLFGWISSSLRDASLRAPVQQHEVLFQKTRSFLLQAAEIKGT